MEDWRLALDAADGAGGGARGRSPFDWRFVDDCRRVFVSLSSRLRIGSVVAVVSPHRGEGRSTIAAGLALGVARHGEASVALVDLDFERPSQAGIFSVAAVPGLTEYLRGDQRLRVVRVSTSPRLRLFPAGAPEGRYTWLLNGVEAGNLFDACRARFAWTILDLPPFLESPQLGPLTARADTYLLVGHHRKTTINGIRAARALLPADQLAGFVMTSSGGARNRA
jgi:protein-tyrosine kinase